MDEQQLIALATKARQNAYAPYSGFPVGAALLGRSGRVYTGCNVENASYSLTVCAERVALLKAVSEGERQFEAIAIVTASGATPCGACRQVLTEFGPDMRVLIATPERLLFAYSASELLPGAFGARDLL
jgi:cytidine deaminase